MSESNLTTFKKGIFFGLGFFLPIFLFGVIIIGAQKISNRTNNYSSPHEEATDHAKKSMDKSGIEIVNYRDIKSGNYTYIVGSYKNISNEKISSFTIEAEFFDKDGNFVWQEHESVYRDIEPNETRNFAIKCGCHEHAIPEYSKVVMSAYK